MIFTVKKFISFYKYICLKKDIAFDSLISILPTRNRLNRLINRCSSSPLFIIVSLSLAFAHQVLIRFIIFRSSVFSQDTASYGFSSSDSSIFQLGIRLWSQKFQSGIRLFPHRFPNSGFFVFFSFFPLKGVFCI